MILNFTLRDILGSLLGVVLFLPIFVAPGYVAGWFLNILSFKERNTFVRLGLGILLSFSISPILLFLSYRFLGYQLAFIILALLSIIFSGILIHTSNWAIIKPLSKIVGTQKNLYIIAFSIMLTWIIFSILFLSDLQFDNRLYNNSVSFDHTTRVSVIQAITRTGVPPINPSFFPGHPEKLTFLYYFWYILASAVDKMGGKWVDARMALYASIVWCGIGLMAAIAVYTRQRIKNAGNVSAIKNAIIGFSSLLISGFDIFPTIGLLLASYKVLGHMTLLVPGDMEHWNEQITAWIGSLAWIPHHVAAMIACMTGMILLLWSVDQNRSKQFTAMLIGGLGFASAFGLSVWVTIVFAVFWVVLGINLLFDKHRRLIILPMLLSGAFALLSVSPFIFDIFSSRNPGGQSTGFPLMPAVRPFDPIQVYVAERAAWIQSITYLLVLPVNYLLELGFFFLVGLLRLSLPKDKDYKPLYFQTEKILLITTLIFVSFFRSTVIANNDFGWRGWLFGQFVLLIWGADVLEFFWDKNVPRTFKFLSSIFPSKNIKKIIQTFLIIGVATTILDLFFLRFWTSLQDAGVVGLQDEAIVELISGRRTYDGRLAFEYVNNNLPQNAVEQFNPDIYLGRVEGLYGARQAVISTHSLYGVSEAEFLELIENVSVLFESKIKTWPEIEKYCEKYKIDVLVFSSIDPVWPQINDLDLERSAVYKNQNFAVFLCR